MDTTNYIPRHFSVSELVPPDTYKALGEAAIILMDSRILWTIDAIRDMYGCAIIVNNGTSLTQRGFRNVNDIAGEATYSQHKYGRAIDFDCAMHSADEIRQKIITEWRTNPAFQFITAIEVGIPWVHIDCRNTQSTALLQFHK